MKFIKLTSRQTSKDILINVECIQLVRTIVLNSTGKADGCRIFFDSKVELDDYTEVKESVKEIQSAIAKLKRGDF